MIGRYVHYLRDRADAAGSSVKALWFEDVKQGFPWIVLMIVCCLVAQLIAPKEHSMEAVLLSSVPGLAGWLVVTVIFNATRKRQIQKKFGFDG